MNITVLMGGTSAERDVSIASGLRIAAALRSRGHDVISLDTAKGVIDSATEQALMASGVQQAPPDLDALVVSCLAKDRADRPRSPRDLLQRLDAIALHEPWTDARACEWWKAHLPQDTT